MGLLSLAIFTTKRRTKEIGIRKVNGAKVSEVMAMLNKDFVRWVAIAFVIATPVSWYAMTKWLESFSYKTSLSWWIFALAGLLALGIAFNCELAKLESGNKESGRSSPIRVGRKAEILDSEAYRDGGTEI
jgi:hypothetical protein